jgi:hypothetical protein
MSNGCFRCDKIAGQFYEHDPWGVDETVHTVPMWIARGWLRAIRRFGEYNDEEESSVFQRPESKTWNILPADAAVSPV